MGRGLGDCEKCLKICDWKKGGDHGDVVGVRDQVLPVRERKKAGGHRVKTEVASASFQID